MTLGARSRGNISYTPVDIARAERMIAANVPGVVFEHADLGYTSRAWLPNGKGAHLLADAWHGCLRDPWFLIGALLDWQGDQADRARLMISYKLRRAEVEHAVRGGYHINIPLYDPGSLSAPIGPAEVVPVPLKAGVSARGESVGYHHQGRTYEWWNVIIDGKIIDMIPYERRYD